MIRKVYCFRGRIFWFKAFMLLVVAMVCFGCGSKTIPEEVWGRADAKEVDINSKIPGRVIVLSVKEGDKVTKGQVLARVDSRDLTAKAEQAKAGVEALRAQLLQASTATSLQDQTAQATLNTAQAQLIKTQSELALAESDYQRFSELVKSGAVSQLVYDGYKTKYQAAQAGFTQAQAAVAAAQAGLLQTKMNRSNEEALNNKIEQAQAAVQEVEVNLDETEIRAPFDGIVTAKYVEEGAMVSTGMPIVAIQDPGENWVNVKVKETELSNYKLQQTVALVGRDGNLTLQGKIIDISKKPEFATYRATNERGDSDIITFNVKIQVNSEQIRPGMRFRLAGGDK